MMRGACLCGGVTVEVGDHSHEASACHCDLCRRWSGSPQWGFDAPAAQVAVTGTVATYRATPFSERAFCPVCGTHLWLRDDGGPYEFVPGLFEAARDMPLTREVYSDRAFACAPLAGGHERVTREAYEREHPHMNTEV